MSQLRLPDKIATGVAIPFYLNWNKDAYQKDVTEDLMVYLKSSYESTSMGGK